MRRFSQKLFSIRSLDKADVDQWWTGYAISILPVAGSWFAALAGGAAIWAAVSLVLKRFRLDLPNQALPLICASLAMGAWALFIGVYHDGPAGLWRGFLFAAPLFSVPLFIARFRASDPLRSFNTLALYANFGLVLALLLASLQLALGQAVEGGVGNSYVFGFVVASLLTVSMPMAASRFLAERSLLLLATLVLLYVADTRIHLVFVVAYACVFLFTNMKIASLYKLAAAAAVSFVLILFFRSTFSGMVTEIIAVGEEGLPHSFGVRVELWKAGLAKLQEVRLTGTGFENKMPEVIKMLPGHLSYIRFSHLHNMFIDAAVAMGIPGLVLLCCVLAGAVFMMSGLDCEMRLRGYAFLALCVAHGSLGPLLTHDIVVSVFVVILSLFASCLGRVSGRPI